jgi:hypothetical protein
MKQKFIYLSFAILMLVMFISVWINRECAKLPVLSQEVIGKEATDERQEVVAEFTQHSSALPGKPPAITIIKKASNKKALLTAGQIENILEKTQKSAEQTQTGSSSSSSNQIPSSPPSNPESPASGITKDNKFPTPEESKEMNAQGIVMY